MSQLPDPKMARDWYVWAQRLFIWLRNFVTDFVDLKTFVNGAPVIIELDGDFGSGQTITLVCIGKVVFAFSPVLTAVGGLEESSDGIIPIGLRPLIDTPFYFDSAAGAEIDCLKITSSGKVILTSGGGSVQPPTVTYEKA